LEREVMAKTVIILDFNPSSVNAGVFNDRGRSLEMVEYFSSPAGDMKKAAAEVINAMRSKGITDFSHVIAGLPANLVSLRIMELPFSDRKKLEEILPFEARDVFLKNVEELALCAMPLADGRALAAAVDKASMSEWLEFFKGLGADPFWVTSSLFSKHILLKRPDVPEVSAFVDASSVTVVKGGKPRFFKGISGAVDLSFALRALVEDGIVVEKFYATPEASRLLKDLGKDAAVLNEYAEGKAGIIALARHFKEGPLNDALNFRMGEFSDDKDIKAAEKGFRRAAALLVVLVVLWGAYSYLRYSAASASLVQSNRKLEGAYRDLFPGERVVDATLQLEAKLKGLKDEKGVLKDSVNPDDIMAELSEAVNRTDGGARIYSLHIGAGRLIASGYAGSFEGANNFRDAVSRLPYFKEITLTDVKSRAGGGASFSLSASIPERP
jgi:type II secretion system (T2SS) protein L